MADPFHCYEEFAFPGAFIAKSYGAYSRSALECPYCHEPMKIVPTVDPARVRTVLEKRPDGQYNVLADRIPTTHLVIGCEACEQMFTLPKAGAEHG